MPAGSSESERTSADRAPASRAAPGGRAGSGARRALRGPPRAASTEGRVAERERFAFRQPTAFEMGTQHKKPTEAESNADTSPSPLKGPARHVVAARAGIRRALAGLSPLTRPSVRSARPLTPPPASRNARGHRRSRPSACASEQPRRARNRDGTSGDLERPPERGGEGQAAPYRKTHSFTDIPTWCPFTDVYRRADGRADRPTHLTQHSWTFTEKVLGSTRRPLGPKAAPDAPTGHPTELPRTPAGHARSRPDYRSSSAPKHLALAALTPRNTAPKSRSRASGDAQLGTPAARARRRSTSSDPHRNSHRHDSTGARGRGRVPGGAPGALPQQPRPSPQHPL